MEKIKRVIFQLNDSPAASLGHRDRTKGDSVVQFGVRSILHR